MTHAAAILPANPASSEGMRPVLARWIGALGGHAFLIALGAVVLLPYVWMLLTAARAPADIFADPFGLPTGVEHLQANVARAFDTVPLLRFMANGLVVVTCILFLQLAFAIPCAYALAKGQFRGQKLLFALILTALCVPIQVPMLPIYLALAKLGALDSYAALIVPFALSPFAIFLLRQQFKSYPDEIIQAARLDGFSEAEIVMRLIVPSARPVIAAFAVFSVTAHWNDLYWPMIVITSLDKATPPLGMLFFKDGDFGTDYGALMVAAIVTVAPILIAFLFAQRQFIRGLTMTGLR